MVEWFYSSRVTEPDPDEWTNEMLNDGFRKPPMDGTHPYASDDEYNFSGGDLDYRYSWESGGFDAISDWEEEYPAGTDRIRNPRATHVNEPGISFDLCHRCNSKRWEAFLSTSRESKLSVAKTPLEPSCRICRLIASVMEAHKLANQGDYLLKAMTAPAIANKAMAGLPALTGSNKMQILHIRPRDPITGVATKILPHLVAADFPLEENSIDKRYYQTEHVNLDQIKRWMDDCYITHASCSTTTIQPSLRQLRVIDCDQKVVVIAPAGCHYVALSYVWGHCNVDLDNLKGPPKTIADSMILTQRLGYKYLWIDRYVCSSRFSVLYETDKRSASTKMTA